MERLLVLKLEARNCSAEALLNDFPLGRAGPGAETVHLPVHEFTVSGPNHLELVVNPRAVGAPETPPEQVRLASDAYAALHLLLPRVGKEASEHSSRSLATLEWSLPGGDSFKAPLRRIKDVDLPVSFPVWRWCKAPPAEPGAALKAQALAAIQQIAADLERGETASFHQLTRLRTEELALAYQRDALLDQKRLDGHLVALQQAGAFQWVELASDSFQLRAIAGGRLVECLDGDGQAALRTEPDGDGIAHAFPLRLAVVAGMIYALR